MINARQGVEGEDILIISSIILKYVDERKTDLRCLERREDQSRSQIRREFDDTSGETMLKKFLKSGQMALKVIKCV